MKRFFLWIFFLLFLLVLILGVLGFVAFRNLGQGSAPSISANTLLVLDWKGGLRGHQVPVLEQGATPELTLSRLLPALRSAVDDPRIQGILIENGASLGRAQLHEVAQVLEEFRAAGKAIHARVDVVGDGPYLLASLADRLSMSPSSAAGLYFQGSSIQQTYRRELTEKLGLRMRVRHVGEAKGFGETWTLDSMSLPVRENLGLLVEDRQRLLSDWIAGRRGIQSEDFRRWIEDPERFVFQPEEALELNLVDALEPESEYEQFLEENYGDAQRLSVRQYARQPMGAGTGGRLAVLWAEGTIVPGKTDHGASQVRIYGKSLVEEIQRLQEDESVLAVVLRVSSPGGVVLPSEEIYLALKELAADKPLLVSMGGVAASGGYYISLPARRIYADPWTVTGSIGVVAMLPDFSGSFDKLGLRADGIYSTPLSRLSPGLPVEDELLEALGQSMDRIYSAFRQRVLEHRPVPADQLDLWTEGRVWSARRAQGGGLVDSLGTLQDALADLAGELQLEDPLVEHYPRSRDLLDLLLSGELDPADLIPLFGRAGLQAGLPADLLALLPDLPRDDPASWLRAEWLWQVQER